MKRILCLATVVVTSIFMSVAFAQDVGNGKMTMRDRAHARKAARFGGMLVRPNAHPGKFSFVNAQSKVASSNLTDTIGFLQKTLRANVVLENGKSVSAATALSTRKNIKADGAVFLIDDKQMTDMMLISPEGKWAIVNINPLVSEGMAQPFAVARLKKEMVRAFVYLAGGCGSEFSGNLMDQIERPDQLDSYADTRPPMDLMARISRRLPQLGVMPSRIATYQQACHEGWAPAPTNDVQKAIWDKVHAMPKTPMKIEFDLKKGR